MATPDSGIPRGTWTHMVHRSQDLPHADFPRRFNQFVRIYIDVGKRRSTCFMCDTLISAHEQRLCVAAIRPQPMKFRTGGQSRFVQEFAHPECMAALLGGAHGTRSRCECIDCGVAVPGDTNLRAAQGLNYRWRGLCSDCLATGRWQRCESCRVHFPSNQLSPLVRIKSSSWGSVTLQPGALVCDQCTINYLYLTVKDQNVRQRADKRFEERVHRAIAQLESWFSPRSGKCPQDKDNGAISETR